MNHYARITKTSLGGDVGELMVCRPWQERLLAGLLAENDRGLLRHRSALVGMARKNGKSGLGAGLALWGLYLGPPGGEVYSVAVTRDQARIVFGTAKKMVQLDPELSDITKVYRDAIEYPDTGTVYRVLSREAGASEGLNPTLTLFDEVHAQPDDEMWNVMQLAAGARPESLLLGITTAGKMTDSLGRDSLCYRLYQHGQRVCTGETEDPTFYFAWWEPKAGAEADHRDPKVWAEANPGLGDLVAEEDFASTIGRTPEPEFRTKRTNVFTSGTAAALPFGVWSALADEDRDTGAADWSCVLMADGSWNGDCTAIVAVSVEEVPHMWVVGLWERPANATSWRVPVADVEETIREACRDLPVVEVGMDPFRWQRSMAVLEDEGIPMLEYPMGNAETMTKAWKLFYDAALDKGFTHDGDPRLARHVDHMTLKLDARGARPVKESKASARHIDLGVCAVAGFDRARWHFTFHDDDEVDVYDLVH